MQKLVGVLLIVLEIETINYPNFQLIFLDLGPFRDILGPPTQITMPIYSEGLVRLCHFEVPKYS